MVQHWGRSHHTPTESGVDWDTCTLGTSTCKPFLKSRISLKPFAWTLSVRLKRYQFLIYYLLQQRRFWSCCDHLSGRPGGLSSCKKDTEIQCSGTYEGRTVGEQTFCPLVSSCTIEWRLTAGGWRHKFRDGEQNKCTPTHVQEWTRKRTQVSEHAHQRTHMHMNSSACKGTCISCFGRG